MQKTASTVGRLLAYVLLRCFASLLLYGVVWGGYASVALACVVVGLGVLEGGEAWRAGVWCVGALTAKVYCRSVHSMHLLFVSDVGTMNVRKPGILRCKRKCWAHYVADNIGAVSS